MTAPDCPLADLDDAPFDARFTVSRGRPSPEELAALTVVLLAARRYAGPDGPDGPVRAAWAAAAPSFTPPTWRR
jgi:Acyl-CoA carboxylase epsilon subunit